jgi:alpha-ketoglutarate-dependent taurine dioxygenase
MVIRQLNKREITGYKSPFLLGNEIGYQAWREKKLEDYPEILSDIFVEVSDFTNLTEFEINEITRICARCNMAIYSSNKKYVDTSKLRDLGACFGLRHLDKHQSTGKDGISVLKDQPNNIKSDFIPYTNRAINWHTDGYYNKEKNSINAVILHCVTPAAVGGSNLVIDHEMVYLQMRDANPDFVAALMHPEAMVIPANIKDGQVIRTAQSGPVFSINAKTGDLHMRYTARTRSIQWRQDEDTQDALKFLNDLLMCANSKTEKSANIFEIRLQAGQGLISNNVLHNRSAFTDDTLNDQLRTVYRARYYDRMRNTSRM